MYKSDSITENEIHKIHRDIEIQACHLIQARRPDLVFTFKEKTCHLVDLAVPKDHRKKIKEKENIEKYLDQARKLIGL